MQLVNNAEGPSHFPASYPTKLFINNQWVDSVSGETIPVINPSTEQEICQVARAKKEDVDLAVAAAKAAFEGVWSEFMPL